MEKKDKPIKEGEIVIAEGFQEGRNQDYVTKVRGFIVILKNASLDPKKRYQIKITGVYATYAFGRILRELPKENITESE